jgi:hypothetical protein
LSPTGNKKDNVTVIYTPWSNLKKDGSMAVGQVGFKDPRKVRWFQGCLEKNILTGLLRSREFLFLKERTPSSIA